MLGIVSDTHGRHDRLAVALRLLREAGAEVFAHCGDIGSEKVLDELAGCRSHFVWGNTDAYDPSLDRYAVQIGLPSAREVPVRFEHQGKRFAIFHGHEPAFNRLMRRAESALDEFVELAACDYLLSGHSHVAHDQRIRDIRWINPGALQRAPAHTVALLDAATDALQHFELPQREDGSLQPYRVMQ